MTATTQAAQEHDTARTGPGEEFATLVERHAQFLFRVAYTLTGNPHDAEDAVQDTFLKLCRAGGWRHPMNDERAYLTTVRCADAASWRHPMNDERAYLARAVWRAALDRRSTADARALRHAEDVSGLLLPNAALDPEAEALAAGDRALLRRLLARLPEDLRQCLLLSSLEGMSGREVALTLHLAEATVRTRVHRARGELRRMFLREAKRLARTAEGVRP